MLGRNRFRLNRHAGSKAQSLKMVLGTSALVAIIDARKQPVLLVLRLGTYPIQSPRQHTPDDPNP